FYDGGEAFQEVRDVTGYGDERFLVVGTGGHMRHRNSAGNWSNDLSGIKEGLASRAMTGAWSGAEAIIVSAHKATGTPALELWTCPQSASPRFGESWTRHTLLAEPGGQDPQLNDLWGLSDGTVVAVGSSRLQAGWSPLRRAVVFVRSPAP
ncbi:MAG: hypothetical protein QF464_08915, partial [Myxococcota bacterium]|nr:hypothetical protein [Myxococcota bacterium]